MRHRLTRLILLAVTLVSSVAAGQYTNPAWTAPMEPFRLAGPIHYVGTQDLAAYLITTTEGHILLDGAVPESAPLIEQSIRSLGFKPEDIRFSSSARRTSITLARSPISRS